MRLDEYQIANALTDTRLVMTSRQGGSDLRERSPLPGRRLLLAACVRLAQFPLQLQELPKLVNIRRI